MKKTGLYKTDWFAALLFGALFLVFFFSGAPFLEQMEYVAYDVGVNMTSRSAGAKDNIAVIAIDDHSIERVGRWPWSRSVLGEMLDVLQRADARAVGLLIFLSEPQTDPGLAHIRKLKGYVEGPAFPKNNPRLRLELARLMTQAEKDLDADSRFARTIPKRRNIYLPMFFDVGKPLGKPDAVLPGFIQRHRLTTIVKHADSDGSPYPTTKAHYPLEQFGLHAAGVGHLNLFKDPGGGVRTETLVLEHYGQYYPSLALLLAARGLNLGPRDIEINMGQGVKLGRLAIKTDAHMQMYTGFYGPERGGEPAFATYSFHDVLTEKLPRGTFKNKIVLIGATAVGVGNKLVTPANEAMSEPELLANTVASILNQDFYTRPAWVGWAEAAMFLAVLLYLMFVLPNLGAGVGAGVSSALLLLLIAGGHYLMISEKIWLRGVSPALFLLAGHLLLTTKRFFATERLKLAAESDSAQTNRMLGLAFQGQGQFDMAMDKFRRLTADESVLELIYNLALDFERKRQFSKAGAAYDYILGHDAKFRDAGERKKRAQAAESTIMLGAKGATATGTVILDGVDQKPTLGRYQVEKELGKGAMGTVYLGRDPRINRVVAIKTLALSLEFDESELQQVKNRFFREAETAGKLNHPNIVTIYDAGEEHDLAFIAMEYLQGKDLTHYINADKPLPAAWVMDVCAKVADALDYAHRQGVVHRDIKPANIMYNEADNSVKVTDFGIARITASSRTRTGVVLGTPSYMSPEQLAGKPVDGRSDLFSLGVTMFELLTGKQPFGGDSMAALMYQIANAKHPDATRLRTDLPPCARTIVDRALLKEPEKRFQSGEEMRQALLKCQAALQPEKGAKAR
ncbi:MAG: serine/threonine protein kinase [Candidatus Muproteobacteria bacterium RIFCSPHIGHO2_01_FULL_65_16]|uniref:non-specific serine/threonine protein kinase n=1 Tax=Candidatus Muproteobacteria bacterium RIFCSPHIGHO2_01_FULL_65_16 TaxID=1817764 RepID=A0A1F6TQ79_9PROT|nr:MAG: serine/threonine protein kinase [Candidatus Muproteobacteria bacterium RIFCSPHIGHO2_01_FULL_65_16]